MIHFPRTHSPRPSARGGRGRGGGRAGRRVPWPGCAFPAAARPGQPRVGRFVLLPAWAASQAQPACSCGLAFLPSPPFFFLFKGGAAPQPAVPSARVPLPPRLRGSRHLDPRRAVLGSKEQPRPLGPLPAARPPAGWPLSHRFHRSRPRFPAPSPSLPSLTLGTVQLAARPPRARCPPASLQARRPPTLQQGPAPPPSFPSRLQGWPPLHLSRLGGQVPLLAPAQPSAHSLGPAVGSSGSLGGSSVTGRQPIRPRPGVTPDGWSVSGSALVPSPEECSSASSGSTSRPFPSAHPQLSKARPSSPPAAQPEPVLRPSPSTPERLPSLGRACPPSCSCVPDTRRCQPPLLGRGLPAVCTRLPLPGQPFPPPSTLSLGSPFHDL